MQAEAEFKKLWAAANLGGEYDEANKGKRAAAINARQKFETVDIAPSKPTGKTPAGKKVSPGVYYQCIRVLTNLF